MTKKIIILGARGFIGGWLLKRFSKDSLYEVQGYSSSECNLLSLESINKALSSVTREDVLIMTSSVTRLKENSYKSMAENILMAENISRFIEKHPIKQIIFLSTVDVYGRAEVKDKISEKLLPDPYDYYALSKLCSEFILKKCCTKNNIFLLILRLSGVYGSGDEGKSTINKLIESAIKKGNITIFGDGSDKRDFVYVDDVYKIINQAIDKDINMTLNVATGKSYSIARIVEIIKAGYPNEFLVEYKPKETSRQERIKDQVYDTSLLNRTFPGLSFISLEEGISLYLKEYIRKH